MLPSPSRVAYRYLKAKPKHYKLDRSDARRRTRRDKETEEEEARDWGFYSYRKLSIVPLSKIVAQKVWHPRRIAKIREALEKGIALPAITADPDRSGRYQITDGIHRYNASVEAGFTHIPVIETVNVDVPHLKVAPPPEKPKLRVGDWVSLLDPKEQLASSPWARVVEVLRDRDWKGVRRHVYALVGFQHGEPDYLGDIMDDQFDAASRPPRSVADSLQAVYEMWV